MRFLSTMPGLSTTPGPPGVTAAASKTSVFGITARVGEEVA